MKRESFIAAVGALLVLVAGGASAVSVEDVHVEPTALLVKRSGADQAIEVPALRNVTGENTYLTSAAVSPHDSGRVLVATTFHGIYESSDGGASWSDLGDGPAGRAIYRGNGFYEDLAAAAYDPVDPALLWLEFAQDGEIIAVDRRTGMILEIPTARGAAALARAERAPPVEFPAEDAARRQRRELAADHVSFYLSPWQVDPERLDSHMAFAAAQGMTAVVIDFKDDFGRIAYNSELELHREVGAVRGYFDAERVIQTVHDNDLYLIARIVVFKDRELFGYDGNRFALWDRHRDAPWGVFRTETDEDTGEERTRQVEHWVDPFAEEVWDYNIAIARELQELGVDEIQFDYIRTPADGRTRDIEYRYRDESHALTTNDPYRDDREEALSAFLARAREAISLPMSIDVFGFNGWYRMSYLGQDIARLARHVDVISPMLYPSHFPRAFLPDIPYLDWAEVLYREGVARGRRITRDSVLIRPYIQSFLVGGELQFDEPRYTDYLKHQIRGSLDGGASGFTLWNFSGRYYMVSQGLWFDGDR
ncbi:MAG: putative glycoside hydrolase [Alkalispirochaeta sp.]